jgi:class 3 adenylate cyclase
MLFADISGSTRLITEQGDDQAHAIMDRYLAIMAEAVRAAGGAEVERKGDEIVCSFVDPNAAAEAASSMSLLVAGASARDRLDRPMRLRIAFAHGPVREGAGLPFGATVHLTARLAALAKAGQILTTKETLIRLDQRWQSSSRYHDRRILKGLPGEHEIHELLVVSEVTSFRREGSRASEGSGQTIELEYRGQTYRVERMRPRLEIGRDPACDMCVEGSAVSRLHVVIEWDRGRVRLEDVSTNGTVIQCGGEAAISLLHATAPLHDEGVLRLGGEAPDDQCALVAYRCRDKVG